MERLIEHFRRELDGAWTCVSHTEMQTIAGRVEVAAGSRLAPGTTFMGIDIVKLLEEQFRRIHGFTEPVSQSLPESMHDPKSRPASRE